MMSRTARQPVAPACPHCLALIAFIRRDGKVSIRHGSIAELQQVGLDVVIPTDAQIRRLVPLLVSHCKAGLRGEIIDTDE